MLATETLIPTAAVTFTCPYCQHKVEVGEAKDREVITCTNPLCQRQFQAELPKVTPNPELILPEHLPAPKPEPVQPETPAVPVPPEASATGTSVPAAEAPTVIAVYKPPMFVRHPLRFLLNVGLILLGLAGMAWAWLLASQFLAAISLVPLAYGLVRQMAWWLRARNAALTITTRGVVVTDGIFNVTSREVYHETIHGIHIFEPWWGRLTNTGALMLDCGDKEEEIYLDAVHDPHKVAEQIRQQAKK